MAALEPEEELDGIDAEYVALKDANIRAEPKTQSSVVGVLPRGTEVRVQGEVKGWYKITRPDGGTGYVYADLLNERRPAQVARADADAEAAAAQRRQAEEAAAARREAAEAKAAAERLAALLRQREIGEPGGGFDAPEDKRSSPRHRSTTVVSDSFERAQPFDGGPPGVHRESLREEPAKQQGAQVAADRTYQVGECRPDTSTADGQMGPIPLTGTGCLGADGKWRRQPPGTADADHPETAHRVLIGVPVVVDTGTLWLDGRTVRLEGIQGIAGYHARHLAAYVAAREVACRATERDRYRCEVDSWDLSKVVLSNGAGRAAADAPPELVAAEHEARAERRGVWAGQ